MHPIRFAIVTKANDVVTSMRRASTVDRGMDHRLVLGRQGTDNRAWRVYVRAAVRLHWTARVVLTGRPAV